MFCSTAWIGRVALASINLDEVEYAELITFLTVAETLSMGFMWRTDGEPSEVSRFIKVYREVIADPGKREIMEAAYR